MDRKIKSSLKDHWPSINEHRGEIASELNKFANELAGRDRKILQKLSRWFSGNENYESAIKRSDVLAICVHLIDHPMDSRSDSIGRAVRLGFASITKVESVRVQMTKLLLGPALLLTAVVTFIVLSSIFFIPHFHQIFAEFGIQLPKITEIVLKLGMGIREIWWMVICAVLGMILISYLISLSRSGWRFSGRTVGESWIDKWWTTTKVTAGNWAWHMAMLTESGIETVQAAEIAGSSQNRNWISKACANWAFLQSENESPIAHQMPAFGHKFRLLSTTLQIENPTAQVELFREIAIFYWSSNRTVAEWWAKWVLSVLFWFSIIMVGILIFSLFSPLIAILGGLTGGFVGGVF